MERWDSQRVCTEGILSLLSLSVQSLKQHSGRNTHVRGAALHVGWMTLQGLKLLPTDWTIRHTQRHRKRRRFRSTSLTFIQTPANEIILNLWPTVEILFQIFQFQQILSRIGLLIIIRKDFLWKKETTLNSGHAFSSFFFFKQNIFYHNS